MISLAHIPFNDSNKDGIRLGLSLRPIIHRSIMSLQRENPVDPYFRVIK